MATLTEPFDPPRPEKERQPESIEPVPERLRTLRAWDIGVLWGDLGVGLLVLVTGALLVDPAVLGLSLPAAALAIVIGSFIAVGLLALAGMAGADHGIPTMVLFRPVLGIRGSWVPSSLNALQLIGWTAVEFWAMSFVADLVSRRVFGFSARPLWLVLAAVICTGLALWGPVGVTRVWMERFSAWVIAGIASVVTILVIVEGGFDVPGAGGLGNFGFALDLVIAMPISWLPLVADYNRYARSSGAAFGGTFIGYLIANVWLYLLGAMLLLSTGSAASPAGIAAGVLALAGGSIAGVLFLIGLLAGETDEAFADLYSGAISIQNIAPRLSHNGIIIGIAVVAAGLAAFLTMERYESFLFLIGSVFVPLFGILTADYFVARKRRLQLDQLYARGGAYWYSRGFRMAALVPWCVGFAVYHWIAPTGPAWWVDALGGLAGEPLSARIPWLGASIPSFGASFLLMIAIAGLSSRRSPTER